VKHLLIMGGCTLALALGACQQESGGAPDQQNQAANAVQDHAAGVTGTVAGPAGAATAETFVTNAAIGGMYEVEAGRIAAQRSTNPRIKALGEMMVTDHSKAGDELKAVAQAANLTVPTALDQRHQGLIDNLRGATDQDFDRVYLQQQEAAHNETAALLETWGRTGDNDALKAWAAKTLPVVRAHQRMVDQLDEANADTPR
jgi:putative membrane protein